MITTYEAGMVLSAELEVQDLLSRIVCSLVDRPEAVVVELVSQGDVVLFRVHAHSEDTGKLIGKGGKTARAVRCIFMANAARLERTFSLDLTPQL